MKKYCVVLSVGGEEVERFVWAHDPKDAVQIAFLNEHAAARADLKASIELIRITLPPEEIRAAEAALLARVDAAAGSLIRNLVANRPPAFLPREKGGA